MGCSSFEGKLGPIYISKYYQLSILQADVDLLVNNALLYNKPGSQYNKMALKVQEGAHNKFAELDTALIDVKHFIGDLEPPMENLVLLESGHLISNDLDILLDDDPLSSLFQYSLPQLKPPPPSPPPPPPKPPKAPRVKRGRKATDKKKAVLVADDVSSVADGEAQPNNQQDLLQDGLDKPELELESPIGLQSWMPRTTRSTAAAMDVVSIPPVPVLNRGKRGRPKKIPVVVAPESEEDSISVEALDEVRGDDLEKEVASTAQKSSRKKRATTFHGPSEGLPEVVVSVDDMQSFALFDQGWILPDTYRRGGRPPVDKVEAPPRKRARTGAFRHCFYLCATLY